ncbi:hypothetical protein SN11_16935 [Vibrio harveyi]|nr:hypothetical protein SN11_16935 [Vibrio harveyi]
MKISPDEIMESLLDAAKDEATATAAIMTLMAHVNDYKINDLIDSLVECGVIKPNNTSKQTTLSKKNNMNGLEHEMYKAMQASGWWTIGDESIEDMTDIAMSVCTQYTDRVEEILLSGLDNKAKVDSIKIVHKTLMSALNAKDSENDAS